MLGRAGRQAGAVALAAALVALALWNITGDDRSREVERLSAAGPAPTTETARHVNRITTDAGPGSTTSRTEAAASKPTTAGSPTGGDVRPAPTTTAPSPPAPASPPSAAQLPGPSSDDRGSAPCPATPIAVSGPALAAAATRAWVACAPGSPFGTDEAGLEIRSDGRWSKLVREPDGSFVRLHGWDDEGGWKAEPDRRILTLTVDGGGYVMAHTSFSPDLSAMTLDNMGWHWGHYVALPRDTTIRDAPDEGDDECTRNEGGEYSPPSQAAFETAVAHVWLGCGQDRPTFFGSHEDGVEIRPDHTWYKLVRTGAHFTRMTAPRDRGRWEAMDTSEMNGGPTFQLNFETADGTYMTHPTFAAATSKMRLNNMGVYQSDYVHAPEGTVVIG